MKKFRSSYSDLALPPALRVRGIDSLLRIRCWILWHVGKVQRAFQVLGPRCLDLVFATLFLVLLAPVLLLRAVLGRVRHGYWRQQHQKKRGEDKVKTARTEYLKCALHFTNVPKYPAPHTQQAVDPAHPQCRRQGQIRIG